MPPIQTVVMAGGSGTRLWPLSRKQYPKQFLPLVNGETLLHKALERGAAVSSLPPIVITNEDHRFLAAEQLRIAGIEAYDLLLEPVQRNTAPAIALAALQAVENHGDPLLLVLAADHHIADVQAFSETVQKGAQLASAGRIVTFGIEPNRPETGYGYIQAGAPLEGGFDIERFVEKPDQATAEQYIEQGGYLWNSGMFLMRASIYLSELAQYNPAMLTACKAAMAQQAADLDFVRVDAQAFAQSPDDSIDYAVMEHTRLGAVVPFAGQWSDVGAFTALADMYEANEQGSVHVGQVESIDSKANVVMAKDRLVVTLGVEDLVVVDTDDALLVADKSRLQDIKQVVARLNEQNSPLVDVHPEVARPWGTYQVLDEAERFKVKRITVKPGAKLSVQMHHHRAEHWVVVKGTAKVHVGEREMMLTENESAYIPIGEVHSLENPGRVPLEIVEVQSGSYLGEDDIVRLQDRYGR